MRGHRVMVDRDLAGLYGVTTGNLNKAINRNPNRFPGDFMFQLTQEEYASLRFQIGILKQGTHSKYLPYVFTEQGVAMLSSVLKSERAFVRMRQAVIDHKEILERLGAIGFLRGTNTDRS